MRSILALFLGMMAFSLSGQPVPESGHGMFCRPGVWNGSPGKGLLLEYNHNPGYAFSYSDGPDEHQLRLESRNSLNAKLKIPILNKPDLVLLMGYYHFRENYSFRSGGLESDFLVGNMDNRAMSFNRFNLNLVKSVNDRYYLAFRAGVSYNGDYEQFMRFDRRYAIYRFTGILGIKKRPDQELGFGLMVNHGFRSTGVYPFLLFNKTINDRWGFESVLPVRIQGRYNISPGQILLFGAEYAGRAYSVDMPAQPVFSGFAASPAPGGEIYHFHRREIRFGLEYNQQLTGWVWMGAKAGYSYNWRTVLEGTVSGRDIELIPNTSPFMNISIFLSPPRDR